MNDLQTYLLNRGLSLDPVEVDREADPVMEDDNLLQEVAELYAGHENAIKAVLQARVNAIANTILNKAIPQETIVLRQSLVEVGAIVTDLAKYKSEWERRKAPKDEEETEEQQPAEVPPAETSKEGTL